MIPMYTVGELIQYIRANHHNEKALNSFENNQWRSVSTESFLKDVKHLALGFVKLGLKKKDCVGILIPPSIEWTIANIGVMIAGGISIPLFANISEENFVYEVKHAKVRFLFVDGQEQWDKFNQHPELIEKAIVLEDHSNAPNILSYQDLLKLGQQLDQEQPGLIDQLEKALHPSDLANIIYTSGTTGIPKGVELTQSNITAAIYQDYFALSASNDLFLSILPLAHIYGYTLNMVMLGAGVPIYYFNDLKSLGPICQELHPTIVVLVPRLLEKIYAKMLAKVEQANFIKRQIGKWAFELASSNEESLVKQLTHPIVDKLVYSTLREALGGALRIVITGGAALDPTLCRFFVEIGIPLYEGWGMTEGTPITVNRPGNRKIGTVGQPLGYNEVKLAPDGELLARGAVVTKGYYLEPELTAKTIDSDGWLHTGDKGTIDADGYVTIIGRIKELYKSSTGEYISPVPIEHLLCQAPLIDMAMVVADNKKFASCLLFPNFEIVKNLKEQHGQSSLSDQEFLDSFFIKEEMEKLISQVNTHLNHWEQIRAYRFVLEAPSIEAGTLTPSMKLRRDLIVQKYQAIINSMYQEAPV